MDKTFWQPYGFEQAILKIKNSIQNIGDTARNINADFYIIIYPWPDSLEYGQEKFNWEIFNNKLCENNYCSGFINLYEDFRKIMKENDDWQNLIYIKDDIHFTNYGNNFIANKIINVIEN